MFRSVRGELDDMRKTYGALRATPADLTEPDLDGVAQNPDGATALPPAVLVKALLAQKAENDHLRARLSKSQKRARRLEARLRELRNERAYERGRTETLDQVIGALHANLQDLRFARDGAVALSQPAETAALPRPGQDRE
jgi:hypothetical protein